MDFLKSSSWFRLFFIAQNDGSRTARGFADFLALYRPSFLKKVSFISTKEFIEKEGNESGRFPIPEQLSKKVLASKKECIPMKKGK